MSALAPQKAYLECLHTMPLSRMTRYDRSQAPSVDGNAVVIGGSMAGLCAARVLADVFTKVTVFERDTLPVEATVRNGAPQTGQPHALLEAGRATLEDLFPGFSDDVQRAGGLKLDMTKNIAWYDRGGVVAPSDTPLSALYASRPLFEQIVRDHVRTNPRIRLRDGCHFLGYTHDPATSRVTGVTFRNKTGVKKTSQAALTVDASGRASKTPSWLAANGYPKPDVDQVTIDVTYSTVCLSRPSDTHRRVLIAPEPDRPRGAAMLPVENDRWQVLHQGVHGERAPTERNQFIQWAEDLPIDDIAVQLRTREWQSDIRRYPFPASVRRNYHALDRFPERLVVIGDAVASFNPIYGQGMSVAALDALALHHALSNGMSSIGPRVFDRISPVIHEAWRTAVTNDFIFDRTTGPKPFAADILNRYVSRLVTRAHNDGVLTEAFLRVFRLEQPATSLLHPRILWRTLRPHRS